MEAGKQSRVVPNAAEDSAATEEAVTHPTSRPAHSQSISPATWGALTALVLVLGGLAVFFIGCNQVLRLDDTMEAFPNNYVCECTCAGFGPGAIVGPTTAAINVY